jgi:putative PIN family toxin of toxin-antitoxin system
MTRVVLDTNIIVSALLQPRVPSAQLLGLALSDAIQFCVTGSIYTEYDEVIRRPRFKRTEEMIAGALEAIRTKALWFRPTEQVKACADPDDDIFLKCAQAAHADYLETGPAGRRSR